MPMENKSPAIKNFLESLFPGTMQAVSEGRCPFCKEAITGFRDEVSAREYRISGLCQNCQDKSFGE